MICVVTFVQRIWMKMGYSLKKGVLRMTQINWRDGKVKIGLTKEADFFYAEKYDLEGPIFRRPKRLTIIRAAMDALAWAKEEFGLAYKEHLDLGIFHK
jgi:hypothetical protein